MAPEETETTAHGTGGIGDADALAALRTHEQFPTLMSAIPTTPDGPRKPLTGSERRRARRAFDHDMKVTRAARREAERAERKAAKAAKSRYRSIGRQLKERDRELLDRTAAHRKARSRATGVYDAVGFTRMFKNGICEVEPGLYSETLSFTDVSYQSASEESQRATFDVLAHLLNYFGPDTMVQYSVTNTRIADDAGQRAFFDEGACGANAGLASEFNEVLNQKVLEGSSNIVRTRHLTYAISASDPERAAVLLSHIRANVAGFLTQAGSAIHVLDGTERLALASGVLRPEAPFALDYDRDLSTRSPLTAKDFVCPTSLDFRPVAGDATCYMSEGTWCQVLVMRTRLSGSVTDRAISDILDLPIPMTVTWHLQPIDKERARKRVGEQRKWLDKEISDQQQRALSQGYDHTIVSPELEDLRAENERVRDSLEDPVQHLFYFTGLVFTYGSSREELDSRVVDIWRTAHAAGIELATLALRQREGMNSVLPLAHCHVRVRRDLTTTEATILMPFTTLELDMAGGGYYGQNRLSGNLVVCDRKRLMSPHGFVCGMSGSGKSFAVKREIANTVLAHPADEVYVMDVTGEYAYLTEGFHGTRIDLGPDSRAHLNPLDMVAASGLTPQAALAWKTDALVAMASALRSEGGESLTQEERSVIAAAAEATYHKAEGATPVLGDLVRELKAMRGAGRAEAQRLGLVFGRYASGPLGFLNHASDVEVGSCHLTCFDTSAVPADMRVLAMLANLESVRQRMLANHERGVTTWIYIDEVQSLFSHPAIISYLARLWREGRKYGLVCTGMTQSAAAMAAGGEASQIVDQSGFLLLMRQSDADRAFWAEARGLSPMEESYVSESCRPGQGLLIADGARVGVTDDFPRDTRLFDLFSTSPEDYARRRRDEGAAE